MCTTFITVISVSLGYVIKIINDDTSYNYTDETRQREYAAIGDICRRNSHMKNYTDNWMEHFLQYKEQQITKNNNTESNNKTFYQQLSGFLQENPTYNADIKFDGRTGKIAYSRLTCWDKDVTEWAFRKKAMTTLREDFANSDNKAVSDGFVFPISMSYFYREQMVAVPRETIMNLVLCGVAIVIITTPYLVHPLVILMVLVGFVALVFELFALMVIWGVSLNSISMITSIMAIGFAVDYSAHVAHSYLLAEGDTPEQRMINALSSIGTSVFMGGKDILIAREEGIVLHSDNNNSIFLNNVTDPLQ